MPDPEFNTYDDLPPVQSLVLEVLAARYRLGENSWTFSTRHRPALEGLAERGLVSWKHGVMPRTCLAFLTDEGRSALLSTRYRSPAVKLLEEALFLRMNGEYAPGGNENWHDWDGRAERFLRGLLPPDTEVRECRHCGGPIRRCTSTSAGSPHNPICKGWRHVGYDDQPVIGHSCGGRSINPLAEPLEDGTSVAGEREE